MKEYEPARIDPSKDICPKFDETGIALFPVADGDEMGLRVLDDITQDHIM